MIKSVFNYIYGTTGDSGDNGDGDGVEPMDVDTPKLSKFEQLQVALGDSAHVSVLSQDDEGLKTADNAYKMGQRIFPGFAGEDPTLILMGGSSSIQVALVSKCADGSLSSEMILKLKYGVKGLNVRDFIREQILPLREKHGFHFVILTSGFYLAIAKSKDQWAKNMHDLEAFVPAKADGVARGKLMTCPTLCFQNDDESPAFDLMGLAFREVTFDGIVYKPTFTDSTHGDIGGASVYAMNADGVSLNVEFPKGDVEAATAAVRQVSQATGVTRFLCTGVWREA